MRRRRNLGAWNHSFAALAVLGACAFGVACGSSDDPAPVGTGGALPGTGGALAGTGGTVSSGGTATASGGAAVSGGAPSVPAGQLSCGGKLCKGGGHCLADNSCPPFLGGCYQWQGGAQTCDQYCKSIQATCKKSGCYPDGSAAPEDGGYTWLTFASAQCPASQAPVQVSFDACNNIIGLKKAIPDTEQLRCCCVG